MTIFFSTNIPEMRSIMTFNQVSKDIGNIQQRITTGQRINSGKDDPGGLIIREGMRADIKSINAMQSSMQQADSFMENASSGMMQILEVLNGVKGDETKNGLQGLLAKEDTTTEGAANVQQAVAGFVALYNSIVGGTAYNGEYQLEGGISKTYRLGTDNTGAVQDLSVVLPDLRSQSVGVASTRIDDLAGLDYTDSANWTAAREAVDGAIKFVSSEIGKLGYKQQIADLNSRSLDSRLTSVTASEGLISNADIAAESSRLARSELLAQNAMNSIMYNRSYAAFAVSSLFG